MWIIWFQLLWLWMHYFFTYTRFFLKFFFRMKTTFIDNSALFIIIRCLRSSWRLGVLFSVFVEQPLIIEVASTELNNIFNFIFNFSFNILFFNKCKAIYDFTYNVEISVLYVRCINYYIWIFFINRFQYKTISIII